MKDFTAHQLRFVAEVTQPLVMPDFPGSALRGALFRALIAQFCANQPVLEHGGCPVCPLLSACPVAYLAATLDPQSDRGENVPRPFTIEPPLQVDETPARPTADRPTPTVFDTGACFEFGLTMFARALQLFPYVVLAVQRMGQTGLGIKTRANGGQRGRFAVRQIAAANPATGERQVVLQRGSRLVTMPDVPITHAHLAALPAPPPGATVRVTFLTPTRLKSDGDWLTTVPPFRVLLHRHLDRLAALADTYAATPLDPDLRYALVGRAGDVTTVADATRWVHLEGYSSRQGQRTSTSGLLGHVDYRADNWAPFWPWLKWAEITHLGKNIVKGHGSVRVTPLPAA